VVVPQYTNNAHTIKNQISRLTWLNEKASKQVKTGKDNKQLANYRS